LGATVDYAILMTTRFQEELRGGKSRDEAIHIAATSSDPSIITSSLVLFCATLGVSFVSSIDLIGTICVMLARGALISAAISIFIIPSVLSVCEPLFNKTTRYWRTMPPVKPYRVAKALQSAAKKLPAGKKTDKDGDAVLAHSEEDAQWEKASVPGNSGAGGTPEKEPAQTH